jgi:hypothetical protein
VYSVEQDGNAGDVNSGEEISGELVVACGDCSEVLERIKEALDEVALTVEREVAMSLDVAVGFRRDHRGDASFGQGVDERVGIEGLVAEDGGRIDVLDEGLGAGEIGVLTRREHDMDRIAQGINEHMNLGGQSAARSADGLIAVFFGAPALC